MAYLRKEQDTVEVDHAIDKIWLALPKALKELGSTIEQIDEKTYHIRAKTQKGLVSWGSTLLIDVKRVDEKTTRVSVAAETPFTTISAVIDFGRARRRIDLLFAALAKHLNK